jgi:hypothetical protein
MSILTSRTEGLVQRFKAEAAPSKPITCLPRCLGARHTLHCGWWPSTYKAHWPEVKDLKTALKAKVLALAAATVNCPIVFIEP